MELIVVSDNYINRDLVGAHLHTGRAAVNGLININLVRLPSAPAPRAPWRQQMPERLGLFQPRQTDLEARARQTMLPRCPARPRERTAPPRRTAGSPRATYTI